MEAKRKSLEDQIFVVKPYQILLFDKINRVWDAWARNESGVALTLFFKLVAITPGPVRKAMLEDLKELKQAQQKAMQTNRIGVFAQSDDQNRKLRAIADFKMEPLLNKLIDLLDNRGYIERELLVGYRKNSKKISMDMFNK